MLQVSNKQEILPDLLEKLMLKRLKVFVWRSAVGVQRSVDGDQRSEISNQ